MIGDDDNFEGGSLPAQPSLLRQNPPAPNLDPRLLSALRGPGVDPSFGLLMIQHPELVAEHLAATGVHPPGDIPEGTTHEEAGRALSGIGSDRVAGGETPSQQGAAEDVPLPRERPTPSPESPNSGGAVPAKSKTKSGGDSIDDLGKALSGLRSMNTAKPLEIGTPAAPHPSNSISRATLPSVLLQQLSGITKGTTGPYRLGQALGGIRNA